MNHVRNTFRDPRREEEDGKLAGVKKRMEMMILKKTGEISRKRPDKFRKERRQNTSGATEQFHPLSSF